MAHLPILHSLRWLASHRQIWMVMTVQLAKITSETERPAKVMERATAQVSLIKVTPRQGNLSHSNRQAHQGLTTYWCYPNFKVTIIPNKRDGLVYL